MEVDEKNLADPVSITPKPPDPFSTVSSIPSRVKLYPDGSTGSFVVYFRPKIGPKSKPLNIIQISKDLESHFKSIIEISKVRPNKLRVVVKDLTQANKIATSEFFTREYHVYVPARDVEIDGVVTDSSLSSEFLLEDGVGYFKNTSIPTVKILDCQQLRSVFFVEGKKIYSPSDSFRVTFAGSALPSHISIHIVLVPVRLYIPRVMNCTNCKQLGHTSAYCCNKSRCGKCGGNHLDDSCNQENNSCYYCDIDDCLVNCTIRQFADDSVIFATGPRASDLQRSLQDTLNNLSNWAIQLGIDFSVEKTEYVVFSRKHEPAQLQLMLVGEPITLVLVHKYLGVWFDSKCTWKSHIRYLIQKCQQRVNFLRTVTGSWWGAHPWDLIKLYQTTILSVLEYGCFCFRSAAKTHIIKLERIQYRCLRIALGCMHSTHTMSLEVLAGVLPLKDRFWIINSRILVKSDILNPMIINNFERLVELQSQTRFMTVYFNYMSQNINPSSFPSNNIYSLDTFDSTLFFDTSMLNEIRSMPDQLRIQQIPNLFREKYQNINCNNSFYTDGSFLNGSTGFGVYNNNLSVAYKLESPASVYVAELAAIQYTLSFVENLPKDNYFIFTDSLSAIEALRSIKSIKSSSYFLNKIRDHLSTLSEIASQVTLVWIPSHSLIEGNETADSLAKIGTVHGDIYERPIEFNEFFSSIRRESLMNWQNSWDNGDLGRWCHSIIPKVS
ncbi:uncharacterized protein LOC129732771 [Wyeomyia smithii]|uniref:uncharacterized protein LOC129732771 n=1 Tax=Wyeomyia smithii TaxID=174621 RepID=UPI002467DC2E|nr:uncharacterized protein LOC129732771 [Wyeomyia smithii]XP_055549967.1 uncharacterized protein LOC129732771 [Wyeomyia smithii]XP_055549968.1 uncharacterized protein LOC129732771 [Wyeomyia smithii]XP_055549969.1 uncharacterized protein LOC129732771 [Wyeomyia smithii]